MILSSLPFYEYAQREGTYGVGEQLVLGDVQQLASAQEVVLYLSVPAGVVVGLVAGVIAGKRRLANKRRAAAKRRHPSSRHGQTSNSDDLRQDLNGG